MRRRYLEVTFRNGRAFAAYLYLPRPTGAKAVRTTDAGRGVKIDYDAGGTPIGIEITAPSAITAAELSAILQSIGIDQLEPGEWAPLAA
jgi:uncharacterized protein YuzE